MPIGAWPGIAPGAAIAVLIQGRDARVTRREMQGPPALPLYRRAAIRASADRLFGRVAVVAPPGAGLTGVLVVLSLGGLVVAATLVEVPQSVRAVGVLMPGSGFIDVPAREAGLVTALSARDSERVDRGTLLLRTGPPDVSGEAKAAVLRAIGSLERERALLAADHERERAAVLMQAASAERAADLAARRLVLVRDRVQRHAEEVSLLDENIARIERLAAAGHATPVELENAQLTRARAGTAAAARRVELADAERELETARRLQPQSNHEGVRADLRHRLDTLRLEREIETLERKLDTPHFAPADARVVRVFVHTGSVVRPGQPLLKLRRDGEPLEAWLYIPSARARRLAPGQVVDIRLAAYSQQQYGTVTARVTSVSAAALTPAEIPAPLELDGPVFEVRASLASNGMKVPGTDRALPPGTVFEADIVQYRQPLYRWLLRGLADRGRRG